MCPSPTTRGGVRGQPLPDHHLRAEQGLDLQARRPHGPADRHGRLRIETVPGTTHFLPMERPDLVQAGLREAIAAPAP